jgi:CHAT domain-containing protein
VGVAFQDEALAILQRHGGRGITGNHLSKERILEQISSASICHFACHGHFDPRDFLDSGLLLRNTDDVLATDVLAARDLLDQSLDIDLAVLSACETGRGIQSPSDFLGIGRAFLGAGVRGVLTTLWAVENRATQNLMLTFYQQLFSSPPQPIADAAQALRKAQLDAISANADFMQWASFPLTGWPIVTLKEFTAHA